MRSLSKTHLDAALACLYRSHFLENHQLHAIQAITILVVTCQDGAFSNLFPMLLSTCVCCLSRPGFLTLTPVDPSSGICLAQDLGLHRLPSEEAWLASVEGQSLEARAKSLIAYETRKRVFWALTSQDWFSVRGQLAGHGTTWRSWLTSSGGGDRSRTAGRRLFSPRRSRRLYLPTPTTSASRSRTARGHYA